MAVQDAEFDLLSRTVHALGEEFFTVPPAEIAALVAAANRRFADSPVREFVPMLVERAVRDQLRGRQGLRAS